MQPVGSALKQRKHDLFLPFSLFCCVECSLMTGVGVPLLDDEILSVHLGPFRAEQQDSVQEA